ncbi:hypothetical protein HHK36_030760 [Tetracentron sinense]|uniref:Uncharacterized protein n=1 Tax=Tetracentron sinense TaxID=13715 RepID=A0A835D1V1_TETSI|nr:hypothetical protein HHK36_030760 [Tetracentron sinense]
MDGVYKELDEVKAEMEKLKAEYQAKTELSEKLRKVYNEKMVENEAAKLKIEKHAQDLSAKADEISLAKQMCDDLKSDLHEKESVLRHLSSANDKLRADCGEKLRNLEGENRELVLALDEANARIKDQVQKIRVYEEEIECLKGLLSVSEKKCFEAEQRAQASKELRQRDDMLMKLEEENRKVEDQLKWKKEQFEHLEEAHEKLQDQFRANKEESELEKSTLLGEIYSLQTSLDSQTRISEGLQSQLQMCNQALAHEESRRKILEVQVSESKASFENVFAEYQEEKSKIGSLTVRRDEEIASLRNSLCTKETLSKEMEFRLGHLEQENDELRQSLKELQEAQIHRAGAASSLTKLRTKLKSLELAHKDCSTNLKAREVEWSSQMDKSNEDLNDCRCELKCKDEQIHELQKELESCHSSAMQLKLQNEENSVMLIVLKSGFSESHSKLSNAQAEIELCNKEREEKVAILIKQLETKNSSLVKAHVDIEQEHEKAASLTRRVVSLEAERSSQMEKMNRDLNGCRCELKCKDEQIHELQMELEISHLSAVQLKLQNEEISVMLMVLKSGFSESRSELSNAQAEMELCNKEREERVALLIKQLEMKNSALVKAHADIEQEREKATSLTRKVESLEAEWSSRMEKMNGDLNDCRCELKCKDEQIHEVQMELESCHSSVLQLKLQKEEISVMHRVLKSGFLESHSELSNAQAEMELCNKAREERIALLRKQLEMKNSALVKAHADIEQERDKATSLTRRVESLEAEWSSRMEKMNGDLNDCRCELKCKDEQIHEVQMELESCHSSVLQLKLQNEEISVMLMVLKSGFLESHSKLSNAQSEIELCNKEREERIALLIKQLEMKNSALVKAHAEIEQEHEKATSLMGRVESLEFFEQQHFLVQKELEMYKKMLEESSWSQNRLKEQAYEMESVLKEDIRKISDSLGKANTELSEKTHEVSEIRIELQKWKDVAERLKVCFEENQETRKEMEASLLAQVVIEQTLQLEKESLHQIVKERGRKIDNLQQQIVSLEQELTTRETETSTARVETAKAIEEKESFLRIAEEKDKTIESLRKEINLLEEDSTRRELEGAILVQIESERTFEQEKEGLLRAIDEKDQSIKDLQQQNLSLEQDFARSVKTSVLSGLARKQAEIDMLCEAWEKITTAEVLAEVEIQEKNLVIIELEEEISNLQQKLDSLGKSLYSSKQQTEQIEAMLEAKRLEIEKMMDIFGNSMSTSEGLIKELESEKRILLKNVMKLSLEREDLLGHIGGLCDRIGEFSGEDMELMGILGKMVQSFDGENELGVDLKGNDELYDSSKEHGNTPLSPTSKKVETSLDNRSPLKELNN